MPLGKAKSKEILMSHIIHRCITQFALHRQGAFFGGISALLAMIYMLISAQHDISTGDLNFAVKPLSVDQCNYTFSGVAETLNSTLKYGEER